jgi:hypothetical protein
MLRISKKDFLKNVLKFRAINTKSAFTSDSSENTQESKIQQLINLDVQNGNPVPVYKKALQYGQKVAVKELINGEKTYSDILVASNNLSKQINDVCGELFTFNLLRNTNLKTILTSHS